MRDWLPPFRGRFPPEVSEGDSPRREPVSSPWPLAVCLVVLAGGLVGYLGWLLVEVL